MKILGFIILCIWFQAVFHKLLDSSTIERHLKHRERKFLKAKELFSNYNVVYYYVAYAIVVTIYLFVTYLSIKGLQTL